MSTLNAYTSAMTNSAGKTWLNKGTSVQPGQVIEYIGGPCDGRYITGYYASYQLQNVTGQQGLNATWSDVYGSGIGYVPPPYTTRLIYRYDFGSYWQTTAHSITHFSFYINNNEVLYSRHCRSMEYLEYRSTFEWVIPGGGNANTNTGRQTSLAGNLISMKLMARRYASGSNGADLNGTTYWQGVGSNQFNQPQLSIIAIA